MIKLFDLNQKRWGGSDRSSVPQSILLVHWQSAGCLVEYWNCLQGNWKRTNTFAANWPTGSLEEEQSLARGKLIRTLLDEHKIECDLATICMPRERVVQKRLELPNLHAALLADAVTLQLESRGIAADEYVSDYIAHDGGTLITASVHKQFTEEIQRTIETAGLQLHSMLLVECGLASLFPDIDDASHLLVVSAEQRLQCVVARRGKLFASASFPIPEANELFEHAVEGAVDRVTRTLPAVDQGSCFHRAWVVGDRAESIVNILRSRQLPTEVLPVPPNGSLDGWVCIQQLTAAAASSVNFHSPKRGPDTRALRRRQTTQRIIRGTLVAVLVLLVVQLHFRSLQGETKRLEDAYRNLQQELDAALPIVEQAEALLAWKQSQHNLPVEMARVLNALPENDQAYIESLAIDVEGGEMAEVRMEGVARTLDDALSVNRQLMDLGEGYQVYPDQIQTRDDDGYYPIHFSVSLVVDSQAVDSQAVDSGTGSGDNHSSSAAGERSDEF